MFILSGAYLLRNVVSYDAEILHADAYRPCPKHVLGFISKGVVIKLHFPTKIPECRPTVMQRWWVGRLARWLQPRQAAAKACAINCVNINSTGSVWGHELAGYMQGHHSDLASVSISNW